MCFSNSTASSNSTPPTSDTTAADTLNLGTSAVQQRQGSILGRLGLNARRSVPRSNPAQAASGTPSGATTAPTPAGTLGLEGFYRTSLSKAPTP